MAVCRQDMLCKDYTRVRCCSHMATFFGRCTKYFLENGFKVGDSVLGSLFLLTTFFGMHSVCLRLYVDLKDLLWFLRHHLLLKAQLFLVVSSAMHFRYLGGRSLGIEKCWNSATRYSARLRKWAFVSLEGFCMYMHHESLSTLTYIQITPICGVGTHQKGFLNTLWIGCMLHPCLPGS